MALPSSKITLGTTAMTQRMRSNIQNVVNGIEAILDDRDTSSLCLENGVAGTVLSNLYGGADFDNAQAAFNELDSCNAALQSALAAARQYANKIR